MRTTKPCWSWRRASRVCWARLWIGSRPRRRRIVKMRCDKLSDLTKLTTLHAALRRSKLGRQLIFFFAPKLPRAEAGQDWDIPKPIRRMSRRPAVRTAALLLLTIAESVLGELMARPQRLLRRAALPQNLLETFFAAARDDLTISRASTGTIGASLAS